MSKLLLRKALNSQTKLLSAAFFHVGACIALAGTVQVGTPAINGSDVTVPVVLQGDVGAGVAAMDFRLNYDPAVLQPIGFIAGTAAVDARKTVQANVVAPGECVVVLFGMNQSVIQTGEVVTVSMKKVGEAASGQSQIAISQTTMASFQGQEIASQGSTGTVDFSQAPPSDGDNPPDPPTPPDNSGGDPVPSDPNSPATPGTGGIPRFVNGVDTGQDDAGEPDTEADSNGDTPMGVVPVPSGSSDESRAKLAQASDELDQRRAAMAVPSLNAATKPSGVASSPSDGSANALEKDARQASVPMPRGQRGNSSGTVAGAQEMLQMTQASAPRAGLDESGLADNALAGAASGATASVPSTLSWAVLLGVLVGALMLGSVFMLVRKRLFL